MALQLAAMKVKCASKTICAMMQPQNLQPDNTVQIQAGLKTDVYLFVKVFFFQNSSILWLTIHLVIDNEKAGTDLYACNEARTQFCCGSTGECCDDGTYIEVPREGIQIGVNTASPSATPTSSSSAGDASNESQGLGSGLGLVWEFH